MIIIHRYFYFKYKTNDIVLTTDKNKLVYLSTIYYIL